jgi:hypothetical protein
MLKNFRQWNTHGMSRFMVGNWVVGDVAKTVLFVVRGNPAQFVVCGILQLSIDMVVIGQILFLPCDAKAATGGGGKSKKKSQKAE